MDKYLPKSKSKNNLKRESIAKKVFRKKKHSKEKPIFAKSVHENDNENEASFVTESTRQNNLLNNMKMMRKMINSSETQDQEMYNARIQNLEEENKILREKLIEMERNAQMAESQLDLQLQLQNQSIPRSTDIDNIEFLLQEEKLMNQIKEQDLLKQKEQLQDYNTKLEQENFFLKSQNKSLENENKILLNQNLKFKEDLKKWMSKSQDNSRSSKGQPQVEKLRKQKQNLENQLNEIQDKYHELVKNSKNVDSQLVFFTNALNSLLSTQFKYKLVTPPVRETYKKLQNFGEQILQIQENISTQKYKKQISIPHNILKNNSRYYKENDINQKISSKKLPKLALSNFSQFFQQKDIFAPQSFSPIKQTPVDQKQQNQNYYDYITLSQKVRRIEEYLEFTTDYKKKASFQNVLEDPFQIYQKIQIYIFKKLFTKKFCIHYSQFEG